MGIYFLKVIGRVTRTRCEICSKLTVKIPKLCRGRLSGVFIVNLKQISHLALVFLSLTLSRCMSTENRSLQNFSHFLWYQPSKEIPYSKSTDVILVSLLLALKIIHAFSSIFEIFSKSTVLITNG